jgi:amino acid transporter
MDTGSNNGANIEGRIVTKPVNAPLGIATGRRLTLLELTCLAYFTACGGAFGIEPLIGAVGPGWAMVLILLTPALYSAPIALMAAELSTMMPEEGGYYIWVRESLGPFWAVQEAWWTLGYSVMLLASFPVLFVAYLSYLIPAIAVSADAPGMLPGSLIRWSVALLVILSAMMVNLLGARDVGRSAIAAAAVVVGAFLLLVIVGLGGGAEPADSISIVRHDLGTSHPGALLLGLSLSIMAYGGWDNISTYASEVDQPQRAYPRALAGALVLAVIGYALPVLAGIVFTTDAAVWSAEAGWPVIAAHVGGRWLGTVLAIAGLVSMWGLFNAQLLYVSRIPFVMARDGWLPAVLARAGSARAVPRVAIVSLCAITACLALFSFNSLVVMICLLYTTALVLEFLALVILRVRRPQAHRPFRVPGRQWGLAYVCVAPLAVAGAVLFAIIQDGDSYGAQLALVAGVAVSGVILYLGSRKKANALACARSTDAASRGEAA